MGSRSPTKGSRSVSCLQVQQYIVLHSSILVSAVDVKLDIVCILTMRP